MTVVSGLRADWFKHPATHDGCIRASCTQPTMTVVSGLCADWFLAPSQPWWLYQGFMLRASLEALWMYIVMTVADGVKVYYYNWYSECALLWLLQCAVNVHYDACCSTQWMYIIMIVAVCDDCTLWQLLQRAAQCGGPEGESGESGGAHFLHCQNGRRGGGTDWKAGQGEVQKHFKSPSIGQAWKFEQSAVKMVWLRRLHKLACVCVCASFGKIFSGK